MSRVKRGSPAVVELRRECSCDAAPRRSQFLGCLDLLTVLKSGGTDALPLPEKMVEMDVFPSPVAYEAQTIRLSQERGPAFPYLAWRAQQCQPSRGFLE